jgi:hypothetical protein
MPQARTIALLDAYSASYAVNRNVLLQLLSINRASVEPVRSTTGSCPARDLDDDDRSTGKRNEVTVTTTSVAASTDDYAANATTLGSLTIGVEKSGALETRRDHDWFSIVLTAGQTYQFSLTGYTLVDPYLALRNSAGALLVENDDTVDSYNSLITFTATAGGTYFLDVGAYRNRYTGTYGLLATTTASPSPSPGPTYVLSESAATLNEGQVLTSTVTTSGVAAGTVLYWSVSGTGIDSSDFSAGSLTGSGVVGVDGKLSFSHFLANDFKTEGDENLQVKLFSDSNRTLQVGSTATVLIKDTSIAATKTYALTESASTLNEGATLISTVATSGVAAGTNLYWSVAGTGIDSSDFSAGALTGAGLVGLDGKLTFSHTLANDFKTEGDENLQIKLFSDSNRSVQVGTTATVLIKDTSIAGTKTYALTESASSLNEGSTLTSTVSTSGVAAGTTLYWSVNGTGIDSSDFSAGALTGSGIVGADGKFTFSHVVANDLKTEGDETAQIKLFTDANRTSQVGSTATVLIKDSSVASTASGFKINLVYDAAAMAAPAYYRTAIERAAAIIQAAFTDNITLNFTVDISGTGGFAYAGPSSGQFVNYSSVTSLLKSRASSGDTSFNSLPSGSSIQGTSSVAVWNSELKALGLLNANDTTTNDGSIGFAADINPDLIIGVALHEITHAMGRVPYGPNPGIFDLFRFTAPGVRLFEGSVPASVSSYFSIDNGVTKLADYGKNSDPSDFLNAGVQGSNDAFNEYYTSSTTQDLSSVDLKQMDVLGYHLSGSTVVASTVTGSPMISQSVAGSTLTPNFGSFAATAQADLLTGTALKDTFSFLSKPNYTADGKGSDLITEFNAAQGDFLKIGKAAFGLPVAATVAFKQVESPAALTACLATSTQFVYDHSSGNLFFNQNGCASGFGSGGVFAVLQNHASLTAANFQFV